MSSVAVPASPQAPVASEGSLPWSCTLRRNVCRKCWDQSLPEASMPEVSGHRSVELCEHTCDVAAVPRKKAMLTLFKEGHYVVVQDATTPADVDFARSALA